MYVVWAMRPSNKKYQPSLTNPHDALHHSKRAANKGGHST